MANRRTERKTTKKTVATRSPRTTRRAAAVEEKPTPSYRGFFDYFRVSESYTSLILGVVVVVITSLLLIAFLRNRTVIAPQSTKDISTALKVGPTIPLDDSVSTAPINNGANTAVTPTDSPTPTAIPTKVVRPTTRPTVAPTAKPTAVPTKKVVTKATLAPSARPTVKPTEVATRLGKIRATTYTTKAGDDLWSIAERFYKSGYNWVDIAKANNIADANIIYSGMKLKIPGVEKKLATVTATPTPTAMSKLNRPSQQAPRTYTVKHGDDLWDVAVAVYHNGYRWTDIAKANNLANPNLIHSGNVLKIP